MTLACPERLRRPVRLSDDARVPVPVPELQQLARLAVGEPRVVLRRLLKLLCELLAMDVGVVCTVEAGGRRTVRMAVRADGTSLAEEGASADLSDTWCARVLDTSPLLVDDVRLRPDLDAMPVSADLGIRSYAGVALRDAHGADIGTLAAFGHDRHQSMNDRDAAVLRGLGDVIAPLLRAASGRDVPAPREAPDLAVIADAVSGARDVETLSRPLLDALHDLTGLASSYLTVIHDDRDVQEIRYSRNTRDDFTLPEGLEVPWRDTLCKRALEEGRPCVTDVPAVWGDSDAAVALGIQVYVSVPVSLSDGRVWGTLCAADSEQAERVDGHLPTMRLFARLIAAQVEQEQAVAAERELAEQARAEADSDPLTRCASRRVVEPWLTAALGAVRPGEAVLVVYADVDAFKPINDALGHPAGDAVLAEVGRLLHGVAQPGDLVARLGGDEFLCAARLPRAMAEVVAQRYRDALRFPVVWEGQPLEVTCSVGYAVSDGHDAAGLVAAADAAMYEVKRG